MNTDSIEWKDFELSVDLHKHYLEFAVKLNLFHYAITGAILSFHFSNESPNISFIGLILPTALSLALGGFFLYCSRLAMNLRANIKQHAKNFGLRVYPEGIVLVILCWIFGIIMFSVGLVLSLYLLYG